MANNSISGLVFFDNTGTNVFGSGDTASSGVTVSLLDQTGAIIATTTSDSAGAYSFGGLAAGHYAVQTTPPSGFLSDTTTPVSVTLGAQNITGQNLGLYQLAEVAGFVSADMTGTGTKAVTDGVTVQLVDNSGNVVATSTSGPLFGFPHGVFDLHVKPGSYQLETVVPGAVTQTPSMSISLVSGQVLGGLGLDAPNPAVEAGTATVSISGFAFNDTNSDGVFDGQEKVIDGETVQLLDPTGDPIATTTTGTVNGVDGAYAFTNLAPGAYGLRFTPPAGTIATSPVLLKLGTLSAQANVLQNAGSVSSAGMITLTGTVFNDANHNGVQDGSETGLAGADVVLIKDGGTSSARAVETLVTDASGSFSFLGLAPGNYAVSVATPAGDAATTPTTVDAGALVLGSAATANIGFTPSLSPAATPAPAATTLNIILRGQSNAQYFVQYGMLDKLKADLQTMLGFDGTNQKINIVADFFQSNGVNTINSGTAMVGNWVTPINGDYTQGWNATPLELGLLSEIADQFAAFKAAPTAIVWLHNETDSINNPNITAAEWASAVRFEAGLVRSVLGQSASSVPYLFVNAIPFPSDGSGADGSNLTPPITGAVQQIRIGMAALASDPTFNGVIAAQASDINEDASMQGNSGIPNGPHTGPGDAAIIEQRLLASLADTFASSALPGSPLALAGGSVDNLGPQAASAAAVAGQPNTLLITVQLNQATSLEALASTYAKQGGGWTIRTSAATNSTLEASGTSAKLMDPTHILVTFDQPIPSNGSLFYGWGSGRLAVGIQPGEGNAIYDNNNLPIWADPNGVAIAPASTAQPGSISGFAYLDVNGNAVLDTGDIDFPSITVQLQDASGATIATTTTANDGSYTFANVTAGLYAVVFPPVSGLGNSGASGDQTVVVASGQNVTDVDGGLYMPGSILGVAFLDTAGTGQYAGTGVNGEQVQLLDASGAVIATTTTSNHDPANPGVDGVYSFSNLAPGSYSVRFTPPAGDATSTPLVPVTLNSQYAFVNSVLTPAPTGAITGTAFLDANGNGTQDSGDAGIAGVTVTLFNASVTVVGTTVSDAQGRYSFGSLANGSYSVGFATPAGFAADTGAAQTVTVASQSNAVLNAGFYVPPVIAGLVFNDANGNGQQDTGEGYKDGVIINLLDMSGTIVATTVSYMNGSVFDGFYQFTGIKPGSYQVQAVVPGTAPAQPLLPTGMLASGAQKYFFEVGVTPATTAPPAGTASIAGMLFLDKNNDGTFEAGESGSSNQIVVLKNGAGQVVSATTTDGNGAYTFAGLAAGSYTVVFPTPNAGVASSSTGPVSVNVADGQAVTNINDGFYALSSVSGYLFNDVNNDGQRTYTDFNEEKPLTVNLLDMAGQVVATTASNTSGYYTFQNVHPGSYQIQAVVPDVSSAVAAQPLYATGPLLGGNLSLDLAVERFVLVPGTAAVSGSVYADANGNGQHESGEAGVAGVSVMLVSDAGTALATVVATAVTDANGDYAFDGMAAGTYTVRIAPPKGDIGTTPTSMSLGAVASGGAATANFGVAANPSPNATAIPAVTTVNIIMRGQSNATYFTIEGYLAQLKTAVEHYLGFDGVNQKVNLIADAANPNGVDTLNPGTSMLQDWISPVNGDYTQGWTAQTLELGLLTDLERQSAAVKAAPTLVLWLHNEYDSTINGLSATEWESAAQYEAGLVRQALGQDASTVPYLFVNAIPFGNGSTLTALQHDSAEQNIKIGMAALAADPVFNATVAAQESDVTMQHDGSIGGAHLGNADRQQLVDRLARSIADTLSASALPGSPLALAGNHVDSAGPQVIAAAAVAGNAHQLLLTVHQDTATGFAALNSVAAAGIGWSVRNKASGTDSTLEATGTSAQIIDGMHLLVTFDQTVPADGKLFYAWGAGRIAADPTLPGNGNAVYDTNSLPIWADPNGVGITGVASLPPGAISGLAFNDANANGTRDTGDGGLAGLSATLKDATGALVASTVTGQNGRYDFSGLAAGHYTLSFTAPSGSTLDTTSAFDVIVGTTTASGPSIGVWQGAEVAGFVGDPTSGANVDGITVNLLDSTGAVVATTTSGPMFGFPHGVFDFTGIKPGIYSLETQLPGGTTTSTPQSVGQLVSGQLLGGLAIQAPAAGTAATGSIAGNAFLDANGNGIQDNGEAGIAGVAVTLKSAAGATLATTTTDGSGAYSFTALASGTDTVSFATPNGDIADASTPLSVTVGNNAVTGQSAGFYKGAAIAGFVQDPSGNPQDGVVVNLVDGAGAIVATTSSGPNPYFPHGVYEFDNVRPGTYQVQIAVPGVSSQTAPSTGALVSGQNLFGFNLTMPAGGASISGTTFTDTSGDGTQQSGESGLAGVNLVLIKDPGTSYATALATMVSDAQGHYSFSGLAVGNYAVVAATPLGLQGTSATNVAVNALANGQTVTANIGFDTNPTPNAVPLPASSTLNIVLRGQSNATYFMQAGFLTKLQQDVEQLLGFDGINQKINIVGDTGNANDATLYPGTGLTTDWLSQIGGNYTNGWTANSQELGLLTDLARQSAAFKSAPTAILYLHNESDSLLNPNLTVAQWQSAVQFEAGLVRGILGQSASTTPYQFVNAIPFVDAYGVPADREDQGNQSIRIGMYGFAADPQFNASIVAQSSDVDMNHDGPNGGAHLNTGVDDTQLEYRLAQSLAMTFAASARPGSAVALANGNLDDKGPQVVAAAAVAGNLRQLLITVTQDQASGFLALGATAAQGVGWSIRGSAVGASSALQASGTAAQLVDPTHILLTFDQAIPPGGSLFYGWGALRLSTTSTAPGEGNAIYDTNAMPIWVDPNGVAITGAAPLPPGSISGTAFNDLNTNGLPDSGDVGLQGVNVTLTDASGTALTTIATDTSGNYSFYGLAPGNYSVIFAAPSGKTVDTAATLPVTVGTSAVTGQNVGVYQGAEIAGYVIDPSTGAAVDGITVNLVDTSGVIVATTTSSPLFGLPHGVYDFANIKVGNYTVEAVVPGAPIQKTAATGLLTSGQTLYNYNVNLPKAGFVISGVAFNDANGNGVQDTGDAGIGSDKVTLLNAAGATVATATTGSDGSYNFGGLAAGAYSVSFATPGGYSADTAAPLAVTLTSQDATSENAGFYHPAYIAGFIFNDANNDGAFGGSETGLDGITINLVNGSGVVVATTTSSPLFGFPHGVYEFTNVVPGTYAVEAFGTTAPPISTGPLTSGQNLYSFNIAVKDMAPAGAGSISGTAFIDNSGGKIFVAGDAGLASETVTLLSSLGTPLASVATDTNGRYSFANLADGSYSVRFTPPSGYAANASGASVPVTLVNGQAVTGADSGFHAAVTVQGIAFIDSANTGHFVTGEALVNGVTVTLLNHDHDPVAKTVTATLNGADGAYSFTDIAPGDYTVRFDAPVGDVLTTPTLNSLGTLTAGQSITLNSGMVSSAGTISVSGIVYDDTNGDGNQEAGEKGLSGVTILLMKDAGTATATAVKTLITDADGGYVFANLAPGNYSVVAATPQGLTSTSATSVSVGALATGQSGTANVGFTTNHSPAVTPVPASTTLNIVLIGQSNAQNIADPAMSPGMIASIQSQLQQMLGFDGVNQKVNILADFGKANGDNTINSGTGLTTDWLDQINGSYTNGWSAKNLELGYLSDLSQQAATFKGAPTAIVMLHNEADSNNPNLTLDEWKSAVQFEAGLTRAVLGQSASSVPWLFVSAIPFPGGGAFQDANEQTIRIGQAALSADPAFGGRIAAQASDIAENEFGTAPLGGHLNLQDRQLVVSRVLQSLADTFASSALPGSPIALANGHIDDKGPQVVGVHTVAANPNQLLITVKQDSATAFLALNGAAAAGVGWSIRNNAIGADTVLEASGTAAQVIDGTHLLLTFDHAVPAGGLVFYAYGQGLIAQPGQSGYGNAVYDNNGMPIWADPNGVGINVAPLVTASADHAGTVQATSAAGAVETFTASVTDPVDNTSDTIAYTEQLAGGATKIVQSGDTFALGTHTIIASTTDTAGNSGSATPFTFSVVDTAAPLVTASATTATVQATSANGAVETFAASATDAVDLSDPVVLTEQLTGRATKVVHSGDTFALGTHTIIASATDTAGNRGSAAPFTFSVVDTTAPAVTASASTATVQATSAAGAVETFTGSATDAVDGTDAITFTEQLAGGATKIVHSGDTFVLGTHTVVASATDAASNTGSAAPFTFSVVDTIAPAVTASAVSSTVQATSASGAVETFIASTTDAVDGTDAITFTEQLAGGTTKTVHSGDVFALGTHTVVASATDAAGNKGSAAPFTFSVVDTIAPAVTASAVSSTVQATSAAGAVESFSASSTDAVDGTDTITFAEQLAGGTSKTVHSGDVFALGTHTVVASATDAAGNPGSATPFSFSVVDTTAPAVTAAAASPTVQATSAAGAVETFTASTNDAVDGTGDPITFTEQLAGGATRIVHSGDTFAIGTHTVVASATDAAGNKGSAAPIVFSVVDTTAPVVTAAARTPAVQATAAAGAVEVFTAAASDAVDGSSDPVTFTEQLAGGATRTVHSGDTFAVGSHSIVASAVDAAGNQGSAAPFRFVVTAASTGGTTLPTPAVPSLTLSGGGTIHTTDAIVSGTVDLADASGTVQLFANGVAIGGPVAVDAQGTFSETLIFPADGTYAVTAQKSNDGGLGTSNALSITLNSTPNQPLFGATTHDVTSPGGDIYALYDALLGRAPDATGFANATDALRSGTSLETLAQDVLNSPEYSAKHGSWSQGSDDAFVNQLYTTVLHRTGESAGVQGWDAALAHGTSRAEVALDFALSSEHLKSLAPTFQAGVFVPDASDAAVARLYYGLLDRAPDAGGLAVNEAFLAQGHSLTELAGAFIGSPEYAGLHPGVQSNAQFVTALYEGALGREPEQGGFQVNVAALDNGLSRAGLAASLTSSPEATAHLAPVVESGFHVV